VRNGWEIYLSGKTFTNEIFNSDLQQYGGSGNVFNPTIRTEITDKENNYYKIILNLPPLACLVLK
jgi:1,4-alpha-glucan branching enzyme